MTTTINASTSSGLVQTADTSGILQLQTANTAAMTIDSSQNVGIGTASPATKLDIIGTVRSGTAANQAFNAGWSAGGSQVYVQGYDLGTSQYVDTALRGANLLFYSHPSSNTERMRITSAGNVGIGTASPTEKLFVNGAVLSNGQLGALTASSICIDWNTGSASARIIATGADTSTYPPMIFATSTTNNYVERMRLNAGTSVLALAGASTTATGTGIAFPATQSASSDANTLDDYEEGTWTPTVAPTSGSLTSSTNTGSYTKIGRMVVVRFSCQITNAGTAANTMTISGFPFANTNTNYQSPTIVREQNNTGTYYQAFINQGDTTGALRGQSDANISWSNNSIYVFTLTYFTST